MAPCLARIAATAALLGLLPAATAAGARKPVWFLQKAAEAPGVRPDVVEARAMNAPIKEPEAPPTGRGQVREVLPMAPRTDAVASPRLEIGSADGAPRSNVAPVEAPPARAPATPEQPPPAADVEARAMNAPIKREPQYEPRSFVQKVAGQPVERQDVAEARAMNAPIKTPGETSQTTPGSTLKDIIDSASVYRRVLNWPGVASEPEAPKAEAPPMVEARNEPSKSEAQPPSDPSQRPDVLEARAMNAPIKSEATSPPKGKLLNADLRKAVGTPSRESPLERADVLEARAMNAPIKHEDSAAKSPASSSKLQDIFDSTNVYRRMMRLMPTASPPTSPGKLQEVERAPTSEAREAMAMNEPIKGHA